MSRAQSCPTERPRASSTAEWSERRTRCRSSQRRSVLRAASAPVPRRSASALIHRWAVVAPLPLTTRNWPAAAPPLSPPASWHLPTMHSRPAAQLTNYLTIYRKIILPPYNAQQTSGPTYKLAYDLSQGLRLQCFDAVGWVAGRASGP